MAMASGLGISPSYLNLIERNQRPITVQLVLKLASIYKIEPEELVEARGALASLRLVFADPLIAAELPGEQELVEMAEAAPNMSAGVVKLYRAYREQADRLSDLAQLLGRDARVDTVRGARMPVDELRESLENRPNHFASLEAEAEAFAKVLDDSDELLPALKSWLKREHGVVVRLLPAATMPNWRRRYDRHSRRLFISERLSPFDQLCEVATEVSLMRMSVAIAAEIEALQLASDEARRLARFQLGRYAAHALMMPYAAFRTAALRARYDIDVLRSRFGVSFEQAAVRLTTLQRVGASGVPFFLLEIDHAGNRLRKAGAQGFPQNDFGGACPKLAVYSSFERPAEVVAEAVQMPGGAEFLTISRTLDGPHAAYGERVRRTAVLIGCGIGFRDEIVYGSTLPVAQATGATKVGLLVSVPVGPACRLCERVACLSRAEPPIARPLALDETTIGLNAFDFH